MKAGKDIWRNFRERFQEFEAEPPERGWENISSKIIKDKGNNRSTVYKVAAVFAILLLSILLLLNLPKFSFQAEKAIVQSPENAQDNFVGDSTMMRSADSTFKKSKILSTISDAGKKEKETFLSPHEDSVGINKAASSVEEKDKSSSMANQERRVIYKETDNKEKNIMLAGTNQLVEPSVKSEKNKRSSILKVSETKTTLNQKSESKIVQSDEDKLEAVASISTRLSPLENRKPSYLYKTPTLSYLLGPAKMEHSEEKKLVSEIVEEKKDEHELNRKYQFQVFFSPRYSFLRMASNPEDNLLIQELENRSGLRERFGYEAGLFFTKKITSKLDLNLGLSLVNLKEDINYTYNNGTVNAINLVNGNNGQYIAIPLFENDTANVSSKYYYAGFTVNSSYSLLENNGKRFYIIFGTGVNLLIKGQTTVVLNGVEETTLYFPSKENPLEQMNFKLNLGLGYGFRITEKMELTIEPLINYYLGSTFKEREPVRIKPYTIGLNIGMRF